MNKTPGKVPGVSVQLGGERETLTRKRQRLQANAAARARLDWLMRLAWWHREAFAAFDPGGDPRPAA